MTLPFDPRGATASDAIPGDPLREEMLDRMRQPMSLHEGPLLFVGFCGLAGCVYTFLWWLEWLASGSPAVLTGALTVRQMGVGCGFALCLLLWRRGSVAFGSRAMKAGMVGVTAMLLFRLAEYPDAAAHAVYPSGWHRAFVESTRRAGMRRSHPWIELTALLTWAGGERDHVVVSEGLRRSFKWQQTCVSVRVSEPIHGFVFLRFDRIENSPDGAYSDEIIERNRSRCLGWKVSASPG
jgi:hypothetical protein